LSYKKNLPGWGVQVFRRDYYRRDWERSEFEDTGARPVEFISAI